MSKKDDALYALISQMQGQIGKMNDPASNPAQQYLTNQAIGASNWLQKGDYSSLPKGSFFNFQMPTEQNDQYKKLANVSQGGTFALSDAGGRGQAQNMQKQYLSDKFARDASQNYQNNVANAAGNVQNALGQAAGAKTGLDSQIINSMQGLGGVIGQLQNKPGFLSTLLGSAGGILGGLGSMGLGF